MLKLLRSSRDTPATLATRFVPPLGNRSMGWLTSILIVAVLRLRSKLLTFTQPSLPSRTLEDTVGSSTVPSARRVPGMRFTPRRL
ncbi:MAG: hypothetical protein EBU81_12320 [Proteobacteria bacterium]|nr:hypothetical protein [Pseudomonadota bacterium]